MHRVLATGMRKRLGLSFVLIRAGWMMLPVSLLVGLAALYDFAGRNGPMLFGTLLFGGWLLTFLLGILQRIVPFLASMHLAGTRRRAPTPGSLTDERCLALHRWCHALAAALLAVGIVFDQAHAVRAAALCGVIGALAFVAFVAQVGWRYRRARSGN
jgi:hypothetical protein